MANYLLTSHLETHIKDENEIRYPIKLENTNNIYSNILRLLPNRNHLVYVCNNPTAYEITEYRANLFFESMKLSNILFKNYTILDDRNKDNSSELLKSADMIVLSGGKILCQNSFFEEIHLKNTLQDCKALVIGISAGTMNLCKTVFNFPEEIADFNETRWVKGLGIYDLPIIPHFDGENNVYQIECSEIDAVNDYILPASNKTQFIAIPNDSYITIEKGKIKYYGNIYEIKNGIVQKKK